MLLSAHCRYRVHLITQSGDSQTVVSRRRELAQWELAFRGDHKSNKTCSKTGLHGTPSLAPVQAKTQC